MRMSANEAGSQQLPMILSSESQMGPESMGIKVPCQDPIKSGLSLWMAYVHRG